jgi:hypothetical protein
MKNSNVLSGIYASKIAVLIPKSQTKNMLLNFFDVKDTVHFEFIPQGQTVTKLIMWKYRSGYVKIYVGKGLNFVPLIRFATMTMLQLTMHPLSSNFWPKNR